MNVLQLTPEMEIAFVGPPLEKGPMPAIFYLALSAEESLTLDPFNHPVVYFSSRNVRIFSFNLPAHGPNLNAQDAVGIWAEEFSNGIDPLTPFIEQVVSSINTLIEKRIVAPEKIGLMGLSRGGFLACHIAASLPKTKAIVSFAPLTKLTFAREFANLQTVSEVEKFNLYNHLDPLCDKKIRFYVGNRDTRIGSDNCCDFVLKLADRAFSKGLRSPPIELVISPSVGHMGHGTSKETFEAGAHWLGVKLGVIK